MRGEAAPLADQTAHLTRVLAPRARFRKCVTVSSTQRRLCPQRPSPAPYAARPAPGAAHHTVPSESAVEFSRFSQTPSLHASGVGRAAGCPSRGALPPPLPTAHRRGAAALTAPRPCGGNAGPGHPRGRPHRGGRRPRAEPPASADPPPPRPFCAGGSSPAGSRAARGHSPPADRRLPSARRSLPPQRPRPGGRAGGPGCGRRGRGAGPPSPSDRPRPPPRGRGTVYPPPHGIGNHSNPKSRRHWRVLHEAAANGAGQRGPPGQWAGAQGRALR